MTLCDENQETMNADKVRQVMEGIAAIKEQWPEPAGDLLVDRMLIQDGCLRVTVEGTETSRPFRKRKFTMLINEDHVADLHRESEMYVMERKARRAERVVAECSECDRRLLEGHPRVGWLRCNECGDTFCCNRCSRGHEGEDESRGLDGGEICTGQCFNIA